MVLMQLVDSFEGYCAPQFEQYFAFARQDFAPQLLQNQGETGRSENAILELRPFESVSCFLFFYLRFAFLFAFSFFVCVFFF